MRTTTKPVSSQKPTRASWEKRDGNGIAGIIGVTTTEVRARSGASLDSAMRIAAAHLPPSLVYATFTGTFGAGNVLNTSVVLGADDPLNPFLHIYHPDHDNYDARFESKLAAGIESYQVDRAINLTVSATAGEATDPSWGSSLLTGTYGETVTGLHKNTIAVQGTFALRKIGNATSLTE